MIRVYGGQILLFVGFDLLDATMQYAHIKMINNSSLEDLVLDLSRTSSSEASVESL